MRPVVECRKGGPRGRYHRACGRGRQHEFQKRGLWSSWFSVSMLSTRVRAHLALNLLFSYIYILHSASVCCFIRAAFFNQNQDTSTFSCEIVFVLFMSNLNSFSNLCFGWIWAYHCNCIHFANDLCICMCDGFGHMWAVANLIRSTDGRHLFVPLGMVMQSVCDFWLMPAPIRRPRTMCVSNTVFVWHFLVNF